MPISTEGAVTEESAAIGIVCCMAISTKFFTGVFSYQITTADLSKIAMFDKRK